MADQGGSQSPAEAEFGEDFRTAMAELSGEGGPGVKDADKGSDGAPDGAPGPEADADAPGDGEGSGAKADGKDKEPEKEGEGAKEGPEAPKHWSQERRERFEALAPEGREAFMEMYKPLEADHTRKSMELAAIRRIIEPIAEESRSKGLSADDGLRAIVKAHLEITEDPASALAKIAKANGVTIRDLRDEMAGAKESGEDDDGDYGKTDEVRALERKLAKLEKRLEKQDARAGESSKETQAQEAARILTEFRDEKDPEGNLLRPHFNEVWEDMQVIAAGVQSQGKQITLGDLYERACRMAGVNTKADGNGDKASGSGDKPPKKPTPKEEERRKLENAKKASIGAKGRSDGGEKPPDKDSGASFADDLRENLKAAGLSR